MALDQSTQTAAHQNKTTQGYHKNYRRQFNSFNHNKSNNTSTTIMDFGSSWNKMGDLEHTLSLIETMDQLVLLETSAGFHYIGRLCAIDSHRCTLSLRSVTTIKIKNDSPENGELLKDLLNNLTKDPFGTIDKLPDKPYERIDFDSTNIINIKVLSSTGAKNQHQKSSDCQQQHQSTAVDCNNSGGPRPLINLNKSTTAQDKTHNHHQDFPRDRNRRGSNYNAGGGGRYNNSGSNLSRNSHSYNKGAYSGHQQHRGKADWSGAPMHRGRSSLPWTSDYIPYPYHKNHVRGSNSGNYGYYYNYYHSDGYQNYHRRSSNQKKKRSPEGETQTNKSLQQVASLQQQANNKIKGGIKAMEPNYDFETMNKKLQEILIKETEQKEELKKEDNNKEDLIKSDPSIRKELHVVKPAFATNGGFFDHFETSHGDGKEDRRWQSRELNAQTFGINKNRIEHKNHYRRSRVY